MTPPSPKHGIERTPLKYLVFAGNYREFRLWSITRGIKNGDALFVSDRSNLLNIQEEDGMRLIQVGTFHLRSDAEYIMEEARQRFPNLRLEGEGITS